MNWRLRIFSIISINNFKKLQKEKVPDQELFLFYENRVSGNPSNLTLESNNKRNHRSNQFLKS